MHASHKHATLVRGTRLIATMGWLGVLIIAGATSLALWFYQGPFTLRNLTISELGLLPYSPAAVLFNAGLMGGGSCLVVFLVGLGLRIAGGLGLCFAVLGGVTGVSLAFVGVFPVDHPLHQVVGPICFVAGLLSTLVFAGVTLLGDGHTLRRWLALPSLAASGGLGCYISLPLLLPDGMNQVFTAPDATLRPPVWVVAISEWAAFGLVLLWVCLVAWQMTRASSSGVNPTYHEVP